MSRCPPLRQARGTRLNTIIEDKRETESIHSTQQENSPSNHSSPPQLKLQTTGLAAALSGRPGSPLSTGTASSCSDTEWQCQMQGLDELYDATDDESEMSEESTSLPCSQPGSAITPTATMNSTTSPKPRNRCPNITIPPPSTWPSIQGAQKNSPVPPTPPPKIPVSPAALLKLSHIVPAVHAPPSLDGSVSSDQVSGNSAPATPDTQSLSDDDWNAQELHVEPELELEDGENTDIPDRDANIEISVDDTDEDWHHVLGSFPAIPSRAHPNTSGSLSLDLDAEPAREPTPSDRGIDLPEDALAILRHIPLDGTPEPWSETSDRNEEMWQVDVPRDGPSSGDATPASALSGYSFSSLSIPSPGGFFAALTPRARHTWSLPKSNSLSSATAENFYNLPFGRHDGSEIVEQVIECPAQSSEEGELTAVPALDEPPTAVRIPHEIMSAEDQDSPISPNAVNEIPGAAALNSNQEYDEHYQEELQKKALGSLDRTSVWLTAQASYLSALSETNPINSMNDEHPALGVAEVPGRGSSENNREKSLQVTETLPEAPSSLPAATASKDSIYWRGFQFVRQSAGQRDSFTHRNARFDATQSARLGLTNLHTNRLLGNYELVRHERPPYRGPFSQTPRKSTLVSILAERSEFSSLEKEQMVLAQLQQSLWAMDSLRCLNGGNLLASPASRRLSKTTPIAGSSQSKRRVRVLDLGGHASCEWGWYVAHDHPNVSVYTAFTGQQRVNQGIKGPPNHRQVSVSQLWKLPFGDNKFDVISARSLAALLKTERPPGESQDEYDLCLQECYRCLKPGGYLEFFTMDAEISHAGSYASATSVEFAFNLKNRGYDPCPTRNFLPRLRKANFAGMKRAWMFLPMGVEPVKREPARQTPQSKSPVEKDEPHNLAGSTADVASLTGLFGGWMWEQWLVKLQMEMGRDEGRLLEGIGGVFDEGRKNGAGWTCLSGWVMKPKPMKQRHSHRLGR